MSKVHLLKWFWAIFYISSDKGGISALRLSKFISVSWKTAFEMLRKIRKALGSRDSIYDLSGTVELDDTYSGRKKAGKRGHGADGKASVLVACENHDGYPGYIAMKVIGSVSKKEIELFTKLNIKPTTMVRTDGYPSNNGVQGYAALKKKSHHLRLSMNGYHSYGKFKMIHTWYIPWYFTGLNSRIFK